MSQVASPLSALKAVADPSRLRLLRLLDLEELSVGELARCTEMRQSSVSRHLAVLRRAGLVEERTEGVRTYTQLAAEPPAEVAALLTTLMELVRSADLEHPSDLTRLVAVRQDREADRETVFDALADDWDALRAQLLGGHLGPAEVTSLLLPAGLRIVDAGSGTGVLLPWLSAAAGPSGSVVAVESSARMARRARDRAKHLANVEVRRGKIEELPVPDRWADAVVLCLSLGHTRDAAAAIERAARALRPGGRLLICDVEAHGDDALVRRLGNGFAGFEPAALEELLRAAGLEDVRRVTLPSLAINGHDDAGRPSRTPRAKQVTPLTPLHVTGTRPVGRRRTRRTK